jgi:hypothetical protein
LPGLFFPPDDGGDMFLRNVGWLSVDHVALCRRRQYSSKFLLQGVSADKREMFRKQYINEKEGNILKIEYANYY